MEGRVVAHQPDMPKGVDETTLAVGPPGRLMVADGVEFAVGPRLDCPGDEVIRVVAENLDPGGGEAQLQWAFPAIARWLTQEETRTFDFQPSDGTQPPQQLRPQSALVPFNGRGSIADRQHDG